MPTATVTPGATATPSPTATPKPVATQEMYRLYNPNSGEHLYTAVKTEAVKLRNAGWNYEGIGWYAPVSSKTPVYRLYNKNAGDHHYTVYAAERDNLVKAGWQYEGIGWYSDDSKSVPLYRAYNKKARTGSHNYTTNSGEQQNLVKNGWRDEGIGWYAVSAGRGSKVSDLGAATHYKGVDLSAIYDFNYYINTLQDKANYANDDQKAIQHFVWHGLKHNRQGKAGVTSSNAAYKKIREMFYPTPKPTPKPVTSADSLVTRANQYSSRTNYLMMVNRNTHHVYVLQGSQGNWTRLRDFACGDGKTSTPTVEGVFRIYGHKYYFDSGSVRCFYASMFHGAYYFHSTLYAKTPTPQTCVDNRTGVGVSHGCVRLELANAKWVYEKIPTGTTVVVSRW